MYVYVDVCMQPWFVYVFITVYAAKCDSFIEIPVRYCKSREKYAQLCLDMENE
jgi:uncharacterized membrane protein YadS